MSAEETLQRIRAIVSETGNRVARAKQLAEAVRSLGNYRWTGVYDVGSKVVSIVAYSCASGGARAGSSGPGAPAYPTFPITKGLTGSAIRDKATVVVGDVQNDPRYLTAFGNTLSEIIVPIVHPRTGAVVGTIDVESERADAFSLSDQQLLEECARVALPLWLGN